VADPQTEIDVKHPALWERLLPVLNDAVGNGQLTRDEAFAVLDSLGKPRPTSPAPVRPWCLCDPGPGPHDADCPTQPLSPGLPRAHE
jgi:hypothetical protein